MTLWQAAAPRLPFAGILLGLGLAASCGRGGDKPEVKAKIFDAGVAKKGEPAKAPKAPAKPPAVFADGGDESAALSKLGVLPAWSAVLERYRLLSRRDQLGIVSGYLVEKEGALRLVDESLGMGTLSIPVEVPDSVQLTPPLRAVLWGAWHNRDDAKFVWRATRVESLSSKRNAPAFAPGLVPQDRVAPSELLQVSTVTRAGGAVAFQVRAREDRAGDGWLVADGAGGPPLARLLLPGEQASYGDQSRMTEDERWQLDKKGFYWLEIGRFRSVSEGTLPTFRAKTPPFRYAPPPAASPEVLEKTP